MTEPDRVGDVILQVGEDGALVATIDRPQARNALSPSVLEGLLAGAARADAGGHPVLVVQGNGGSLSAGADLSHLLSISADREAVAAYVADIGAVNLAIEQAEAISIAVVDGYAVAGGCELLLACDLALATDRARIGDRHQEYGLLPGAGASVRMPKAIPPPLARRLMLTGEIIDGATAHEWGLVSHYAGSDALPEELGRLRKRLARHSPTALRGMKQMYSGGAELPHGEALRRELDLFLEHLGTAAVREGLQSFATGRAPQFPDRWSEESS